MNKIEIETEPGCYVFLRPTTEASYRQSSDRADRDPQFQNANPYLSKDKAMTATKPTTFTRLETLLGFAFIALTFLSLFLVFQLQEARGQVTASQFMVDDLRARGTWFEPLANRLQKERDTERQLRNSIQATCKLQDI